MSFKNAASPTPNRHLGFSALSPIPNTSVYGSPAGPPRTTALPLYQSSVSSANVRGPVYRNPLDEPSLAFANQALTAPDLTTVSHATSIIPFNSDLGAQLLATADAQLSNVSGHAPTLSGVNLTRDHLLTLQIEANDYVDGLDTTLRSLFTEDNAKLKKRIADTGNVPLTFLYFSLQEQMLKLSGDYSITREKLMLSNLAKLLGN